MPNDNGDSDRYQRAANLIDAEAERIKRCVDDVATLAGDTRDVVCDVIDGGDYNASDWIADITALSAAAYRALSHVCGHAPGTPGSSTTVVDRPNGEPRFLFDVRSEMAGPVEVVQANPPLTFVSASDLTGPAGTIPGNKVVVRCIGDRVVLTLRDLNGVVPGTYTGEVTISDATGTKAVRPIRAECRSSLWWG
ncbi:MAG TPA: hypothetical protein VI072_18385 [Polyangiaceae bacterium]